MFAASPNMPKQLAHALESGIPLMACSLRNARHRRARTDLSSKTQIIFGGDELSNGVLKIKRLSDHTEISVRPAGPALCLQANP